MSDLYVGYLKLPKAHRRVLSVVVPLMLIIGVMLAAVVAGTMRDPGEAVWDTSVSRVWTGQYYDEPYPMVISSSDEVMLIVEIGKFSARPRLEQRFKNGELVALEGFPLERDGRQMIELLDGDAAFPKLSFEAPPSWSPRPSVLSVENQRRVDVVGEIVDGKCFFGAMKPGEGKGHKACAVLCIMGDLPPMVRTKDEAGDWVYPLLLVDGSPDLPDEILDLVAEPVRIEGTLGRIGDLLVLNCDGDCIRLFSD